MTTTTPQTEASTQAEIERLWTLKRRLYAQIYALNRRLQDLGVNAYDIPGGNDE